MFVVGFVGCLSVFLAVVFGIDRMIKRQGFRRLAPPAISAPHRFGDDAYVGRCGAYVHWWSASSPLGGTVTVDSEWLHLVGVPTYDVWIERARVTRVRMVRLFSRGVMFDSEDGAYDGVILWGPPAGTVALRHLAALGWPVQSVAAPLPGP